MRNGNTIPASGMNNRFEHYLGRLAGVRHRLTVERHRCTLRAFMRWLAEHGVNQWYEVTADHIRCWLAQRSRTLKPRSLDGYRETVRNFFVWMYRTGYLLVNPWDESLDGRPARSEARRVPTEAQVNRIIGKAASDCRTPVRNRAILELAYGCGLRRCEINRLRMRDIGDGWLRVRGKGDRERIVPLGKTAAHWLRQYLYTERMHALEGKGYLQDAVFLTWHGSPLGVDAYDWILAKHRLNRTATIHGLRHACATHMLRNGASIRVLQELLGHAKLSSTQIYTCVDDSDLRDLLENYHPRG